jgi:hypothetical protein
VTPPNIFESATKKNRDGRLVSSVLLKMGGSMLAIAIVAAAAGLALGLRFSVITLVLLILATTIIFAVCAGSASADPKGLWLAQDGAHVKVGPCGGALCATIAAPRSAVDPETGRPWTDKNNPDPAQRGRPLVGVAVLSGLPAGRSREMVGPPLQRRQRQ